MTRSPCPGAVFPCPCPCPPSSSSLLFLLLFLLLPALAVAQDAPAPPPPPPPVAAGAEEAGWVDVAARAFPAVVKVYGAGGFQGVPAYGTGVVVDERGFVLTAWSIALRTDALRVVTHDGRRLAATIWRADPGLGAALLRVTPPADARLAALPLGDSARLRAGDGVLALGNPFGVIYGDERPAALAGVVSRVGPLRRGGVDVVRLPERLEQVIVTDVPTNPGMQGGPLLARDGAFVGLVGRLVESRATNTIVNYAVPTAALAELVRAGLAAERAEPEPARPPAPPPPPARPDLGLRLLRVHLARSPMPYVEAVVAGSPAARAGLLADDLIVRVGGRTTRTCRDVDEALAGQPADATAVALVVKRGEVCLDLSLPLPPPQAPAGGGR